MCAWRLLHLNVKDHALAHTHSTLRLFHEIYLFYCASPTIPTSAHLLLLFVLLAHSAHARHHTSVHCIHHTGVTQDFLQLQRIKSVEGGGR